jgi:hypothetical protein
MKRRSIRLNLLGVLALSFAARGVYATAPLPDKIDYNRDVRPIFADTSFACHGPDKNARKANMRLDTKEGAFAALKGGGHVLVPGKPGESELYRRITAHDPEDQMPPAKFNKTLSERQIAIIKKWIEQGAEFKGHWAYLPVQRPEIPPIPDAGFVRGPLDALMLAKLKELDLKHAPETDKITLIRRVYFDLIGLPPTKAQVDAFVNDKSENAYETVVDQLLANPHFGERMAVFWLDLVRYADSAGYHSDNPIPVSPYRDYVIKSFNDNTPFDRFTIEQLGGDLLPDPTTKTRVASAYNRLLQTTEEGGAQPKEYQAKYAADRVRNISTVWMGQTMGCCECHDHKFDPTTTRDFYSMEAFFADIQEPIVGNRGPGSPVLDDAAEAKVKQLDSKIAELTKKLEVETPELVAAQAAWEKEQHASLSVKWTALDFDKVEAANGTELSKQADASIKAGGATVPAKETYTLTRAKSPLTGAIAFRLEAMKDGSLKAKGPGTASNGNFVLSEFKVLVDGKPVKLKAAAADFAQDNFPIANAIDGKDDTGWAILPQAGTSHIAVFETEKPIEADTKLTVVLEHKFNVPEHNLGRFRVSVTADSKPADFLKLPQNVRKILARAGEKRSEQEKKDLRAFYQTIAEPLSPLRQELAKLEKEESAVVDAAPRVLMSQAGEPKVIRILHRGNWQDETGDVVQPAVPTFLGKVDATGRRANRLDLGKWLVRKDNPLTARVFVNRVWKMLMGRGLTQPLDDLGLQGELPSNPELLDHLAADFMDHGWDVKRAIRNIVTSGTYRQGSKPTHEQLEADPFNKQFARQGRFRLDAEFVRDNALAISGLLVDKIGGPSVKPYQPAGYWFALNFPPREWENDKGEGLYRRGLYTWWQRSFLQPSLLAFDAPTREECTAERPRSNIPQQALALLNDPTYVEAARVFAEKIVKTGGANPAARIQWAVNHALSRPATDDEQKVLGELFAKHSAHYANDVEAAKALLSNGTAPVPKDVNVSELAAWTSVARAVLNLNETITRY